MPYIRYMKSQLNYDVGDMIFGLPAASCSLIHQHEARGHEDTSLIGSIQLVKHIGIAEGFGWIVITEDMPSTAYCAGCWSKIDSQTDAPVQMDGIKVMI